MNKSSFHAHFSSTFRQAGRMSAHTHHGIRTMLGGITAACAMQLLRIWPKLQHLSRDDDMPCGIHGH